MSVATNEKIGARPGQQSRTSNAFLLAQLGAHATALFAERIAALDLTPPQAGFLRLVATEPGSSQQAIAGRLGIAPSRLVPIVDGLEERGLIERRRDPGDRRNHALYLTAEGGRFMGRIGAGPPPPTTMRSAQRSTPKNANNSPTCSGELPLTKASSKAFIPATPARASNSSPTPTAGSLPHLTTPQRLASGWPAKWFHTTDMPTLQSSGHAGA